MNITGLYLAHCGLLLIRVTRGQYWPCRKRQSIPGYRLLMSSDRCFITDRTLLPQDELVALPGADHQYGYGRSAKNLLLG